MSEALNDNPTQEMICVDSTGAENGKILDRKTCHTTPGTKHLAIQVLVFNSKKELILHERPAKKVGGNVLDAPTTHVLNGETKEQAARRCLKAEYGLSDEIPITILGGFSYEKDYGDGSCENEFCIASYVVFDGSLSPNAEHTMKIIPIPASQVAQEIASGSDNYPVWLKDTVLIVKNDPAASKFFE